MPFLNEREVDQLKKGRETTGGSLAAKKCRENMIVELRETGETKDELSCKQKWRSFGTNETWRCNEL